MKNVIIFLTILLFIVGCTTPSNTNNQPAAPVNDDHMSCAPNQTTSGCALNDEENNAGIFGSVDKSNLVEEEVVDLGLLVKPKAEGTYPGIVMIHEWWGLNDNIKQMARHLATQGYVVLAVDLYDGKVAQTQEEAGTYTREVTSNQPAATKKLRDAATYLRELPEVNDEKIGSIGWCFGGGQSLQLAMSGEPMAATVIYYGQVTNDTTKLSKIDWPVLGIFAGEDTGIPPSSVNGFEDALNELDIENDIEIYPGVGHAFANPSGSRFAPEETKDAWDKTLVFFEENLKE